MGYSDIILLEAYPTRPKNLGTIMGSVTICKVVVGTRRFEAVKIAGKETIKSVILPSSMSAYCTG
jgi:hypothetical protein